MKAKDERMSATNEMLNGIRLIKMNAWERYFWDKVNTARESELVLILKQFWTSVFSVMFLYVTPRLITITIFGTYLYFSP